MDQDFQVDYYNNEDKYWWFVARRNLISKLLRDRNKDLKILDVGCGGGALLADLQQQGFTNLHGIDISEQAISSCKEKNLQHVFLMDAETPALDEKSFDIIIASDTLEHLQHDETALLNWKKILKPGGELFVFVPAFNFLWSRHDVYNHHFRRYSLHQLFDRVTHAGFEVKRKSYWNFSLFFPTAVVRLFQKKNRSDDEAYHETFSNMNPLLNKILIGLLKIENKFFAVMPFPVGVSAFVHAKKKSND